MLLLGLLSGGIFGFVFGHAIGKQNSFVSEKELHAEVRKMLLTRFDG